MLKLPARTGTGSPVSLAVAPPRLNSSSAVAAHVPLVSRYATSLLSLSAVPEEVYSTASVGRAVGGTESFREAADAGAAPPPTAANALPIAIRAIQRRRFMRWPAFCGTDRDRMPPPIGCYISSEAW